MYCKKCGKEIKDVLAKNCPECGASILGNATSVHKSGNAGLSKAMLLLCLLSTIAAIALPVICYSIGYNEQFLDIWWFEYAGGMRITIELAVIAVITGIIGFFTKEN